MVFSLVHMLSFVGVLLFFFAVIVTQFRYIYFII